MAPVAPGIAADEGGVASPTTLKQLLTRRAPSLSSAAVVNVTKDEQQARKSEFGADVRLFDS